MERHTRQGEPRAAVSQVRGLDEYEDRDWSTRKPLRGGSKSDLRTIAAGGCWCGRHQSHDWPGKSDGAPHPRGTWADRDGIDTLEPL